MGEFCYWDAKSAQDTYILIILVAIETVIGVFTTIRLRRMKRLGSHVRKITIIYVLILTWGTIIISQQLYSIFVYYSVLRDDPSQVGYHSQNYVRFDILPGFIVQTIYLIICRFYYKGLMNAIEISHLSRWQQKYIDYLNIYFVFRVIAQAVGIVLVNIYATTDRIELFSQINIWILILDSVIMNVYLGLSLKIYLKRFNHISSMKEKEIRKLKIEYFFMIVSSFMRVVIDILFLTALPLFIKEHSRDECIAPFSSHVFQSIFYLIVGNVINHILPIIWILKIYTFQAEEEQEASDSRKLISSYSQ